MKDKKQKIKIVYEEIEIIEYHVVDAYEYDNFDLKSRFIYRANKELN